MSQAAMPPDDNTTCAIIKLQAFIRGCQTRQQVSQMVDAMIQKMMQDMENNQQQQAVVKQPQVNIEAPTPMKPSEVATAAAATTVMKEANSKHHDNAAAEPQQQQGIWNSLDETTEDETTDEEEIFVEEEEGLVEEIFVEEEEVVIVEEEEEVAQPDKDVVIVEEWPASSPKRKLRKELPFVTSNLKQNGGGNDTTPSKKSPPPQRPVMRKTQQAYSSASPPETAAKSTNNNNTDNAANDALLVSSPTTVKDRTKNFWKAASKKDMNGNSMRKLQTASMEEENDAASSNKHKATSSSVMNRYLPSETSRKESLHVSSNHHSTRSIKSASGGDIVVPSSSAHSSQHSAASKPTLANNAGMKREPSTKSVLNRYNPTSGSGDGAFLNGTSNHSSRSLNKSAHNNHSSARSVLSAAGMKREPSTKSVLARYPAANEGNSNTNVPIKNSSHHSATSTSSTSRKEPAFSLETAGIKREPSSKSVLSRYPAADTVSNHSKSTAAPTIKKESSTKSVLGRFPVALSGESGSNHQTSSRPSDFPRQRSRKAGQWHAFGTENDQIASSKSQTHPAMVYSSTQSSNTARFEAASENLAAKGLPSSHNSSVSTTTTTNKVAAAPSNQSSNATGLPSAPVATTNPSKSKSGSVRSRYNPYSTMAKREKADVNREPSSKEVLNRYDGASTVPKMTLQDRPSLESAPMGGSVSNRWNPSSSNTLNSGGSSSRTITLPGKKRNKSNWNVFGGDAIAGSSRKIVSCDDLAKKRDGNGDGNVPTAVDAVENRHENDADGSQNIANPTDSTHEPTSATNEREETAPSTKNMSTMAASLDILHHANVFSASNKTATTQNATGSIRFDDNPPQIREFDDDAIFHSGRIPDWWMECVPHDVLDEQGIDPDLGIYID